MESRRLHKDDTFRPAPFWLSPESSHSCVFLFHLRLKDFCITLGNRGERDRGHGRGNQSTSSKTQKVAHRFTPSRMHKSIPTLSVALALTFFPFQTWFLSLPPSLSLLTPCPFLLTSKKNLHLGVFRQHLTPVKFKREMCTLSYAPFRLLPGYLGGGGHR